MHRFRSLKNTCRQFHMLLLSSIWFHIVAHILPYVTPTKSRSYRLTFPKSWPRMQPTWTLHCQWSMQLFLGPSSGSKLVLPGHPEICHLTTMDHTTICFYTVYCVIIYIYCTYALFLFYEILRCSCHLVRVGQYLYVASPQVSVAFVVASVRLIVDVVIMVNATAKMYLGEAEQWNLLVDEVRLFL